MLPEFLEMWKQAALVSVKALRVPIKGVGFRVR